MDIPLISSLFNVKYLCCPVHKAYSKVSAVLGEAYTTHGAEAHVLCLCMCPLFGGRLGKRRWSDFFFRSGWSSFSVILPRPPLLNISSTHIRIRREDDVNEMWIATKKSTKLPFEPIIVIAGRSQMTSLLTDHNHSHPIHPSFNINHDNI